MRSEGSRRLLFVVNDAAFFVSHRLPIAEEARARGWDVHVAAPEGGGCERLVSQGFPVHRVVLTRRGVNPLSEAYGLATIFGLYRRLRPDLVHLVTIKPMIYGGVAARLAGVPSVVSAVSGLGTVFIARGLLAGVRRRLVEAAYFLAFGHPAQRVIFQNPDDLDYFARRSIVARERSVLIRGSGVDTSIFQASIEPEGTPLVVLVSRMLKDKGVLEFAAAARELRGRGVSARFALVGPVDPGNASGLTEAELDDLVGEGAVEWWGSRRDIHQVMSESHAVCLPSYGEGVPKVLLEAAASGRPIVTTDTPGCREVVVDGVNGFLVKPRDVGSLVEALGVILTDKGLRLRMGRAGRLRAETQFSVGQVVDATFEVYRQAMEDVRG